MGIKLFIFVLLALFNLFILNTIHAKEGDVDGFVNQEMHLKAIAQRGGGGGGRGGGGGGGRAGGGQSRGAGAQIRGNQPSKSIQRTPSMSRAANERQTVPTRNESLSRVSRQTDTRNQVNQFIKNNPVTQPINSQIGQQIGQPQRATLNTRENPSFNRVATNARSNIDNRYPDKGNWFNQKFFESHDYKPSYADLRGNLWKAAAIADFNNWLDLRNQPYYYGYDDDWGPNVYVDENMIEQQTQSQVIEPQIALNTQNIASDGNWMTLGVYAITKSAESVAAPNIFIQLALAKNGDIAGTYYNATTNKVHELVGGVEEQSQRAFWKIADNPDSPFVETGIYNLTQNVTPIRVYYQNGEVKNLLLIRVES